ncbi:MAG: hypothetical protein Q8R47_05915 [Nanoarchaeota archaeon]|nr:hypothetical protein [Nanoarchaeota archaeon]
MTIPKLPTEKECLDYFTEYKVPDNIFRHCCKVREVAFFLAQRLREKKVPINIAFVSCLAYFHDLCKMVVLTDFGKNKFHQEAVLTPEQEEFWKEMQKKYPQHYEGEVAYELFKDRYPELAISLRQVSSSKNENPSWEQLIVHYADLRVLREKVVAVSERLEYLRQNYPRGDEVWDKHEQKIHQQEQKIFSNLSFHPDELAEEMEKEIEREIERKSPMVQHGR